ncbi:MAG: MFS transporter [Egibacteraceae bacterium]
MLLFSAGEAALHVLVSPYLDQELGLQPAAIGTVAAVFGAASLVARLPVGAIYTASRAKLLLGVGGAMSTAAFALVPLSSGAVPFAALMALDGFGWSIATTTQLAVLVAARPPTVSTAAAMGWYSGFTGLGHTVAGALAGFLGDTVGFDGSFLSLAVLPAIATVVMLRTMPLDVVRASETRAGGGGWDVARLRRAVTGAWTGVRGMRAAVWSGVLVMFVINYINGLVTTFHPVLVLAAGLSLTQVGTLASVRSFASATSRLGSGPLFSRIGSRGLTAPLVLLGAACLALLPTVQSEFAWQVPLFLGIGLSRGMLRVTGSVDAFEGIGDGDRQQGLTAALLHGGLDLGKVAAPPLGGALAQVVGLPAMFRTSAVLVLAFYASISLLTRRAARPVTVSG